MKSIRLVFRMKKSRGRCTDRTHHYLEPFKSDKRKVIGLSIELDDLGKGLLGWKEVAE